MLIDFEDHGSSSGLENDLADCSFDVRLLIPCPPFFNSGLDLRHVTFTIPNILGSKPESCFVSYSAVLSPGKPIGKMHNRVLSNKASGSRGVKLGLRNNAVCPLGYPQGLSARCGT
jgi:hypothetical protein